MKVKATQTEMRAEAVKRMTLLHAPKKAIEAFNAGKIPVTVFSAETQFELDPIHEKVLESFYAHIKDKDSVIPFYITESWHGCDMVSILYVGNNKSDWGLEEKDAKNGISSIFAYSISGKFGVGEGEFGSGFFSIEDGVLWRVS